MTPGQEWGAALRRQMTLQRVPVKELAAAIGVTPYVIIGYRQGRSLPRVKRAAEIADAMMAPNLLTLCTRLRTVACDECGKDFVRDQRGGNQQRWCSKLCSDRYRKRVIYANDRRWTGKRYDTWKRKAEKLQGRVDSMCRACEPDMVCRTADCPLRDVSPFPLVDEIDVRRAASGTIRRNPHTIAAAERQRAYNREHMRRKRGAAA